MGFAKAGQLERLQMKRARHSGGCKKQYHVRVSEYNSRKLAARRGICQAGLTNQNQHRDVHANTYVHGCIHSS